MGPAWYLQYLAQQVRRLRQMGCAPVYVCDGVAPVEKAEERKRRSQRREDARDKLGAALSELADASDRADACTTALADLHEAVDKLERRYFEVLPEHLDRAKLLLTEMGAAVVQAAGEAERTLAHLQRAGHLDHIFTEDVDALICGADSYVKDSSALLSGGDEARLVLLQPALDGLGCTYEGFVTMSLLSGTDFAPKLPRMGPATAHKLVQKHGSDLEQCLRATKQADDELIQRYLRARSLLTYDPSFELPEIPLQRGEDLVALGALCDEIGSDAFELRQYLGVGKRRRLSETSSTSSSSAGFTAAQKGRSDVATDLERSSVLGQGRMSPALGSSSSPELQCTDGSPGAAADVALTTSADGSHEDVDTASSANVGTDISAPTCAESTEEIGATRVEQHVAVAGALCCSGDAKPPEEKADDISWEMRAFTCHSLRLTVRTQN